jgi:predicted AAA+ superfamily ATPase
MVYRRKTDIPDPVQQKKLIHLLMNTTSRLISVNKLRHCLTGERNKLSPEVMGDYIDKLNGHYLMFTVPTRSCNAAVQAANQKNVYCIDHTMARAFSLPTSENSGLALENPGSIELRRTMENILITRLQGQ